MTETPEEVEGRVFFGTRPRNVFEAAAMDLLDTIPVIGTVTALERAEKYRMFGKDTLSALEVVKSIPIVGLFVAPNTYNYMTENGIIPAFKPGELKIPGLTPEKGGE